MPTHQVAGLYGFILAMLGFFMLMMLSNMPMEDGGKANMYVGASFMLIVAGLLYSIVSPILMLFA